MRPFSAFAAAADRRAGSLRPYRNRPPKRLPKPATPVPPTPTPIVTEFGAGQLQLSYWHGLTGADGVTMQAMVEQFVADNPDISVRVEAMAWETFGTSCSPPWSPAAARIFILHEFLTQGYARQGVLRPLRRPLRQRRRLAARRDFKPQLLEHASTTKACATASPWITSAGACGSTRPLRGRRLDPDTPPTGEAELLEAARLLTVDANGPPPQR